MSIRSCVIITDSLHIISLLQAFLQVKLSLSTVTDSEINIGLAVGLSVGTFFLLIIVGVPLCIVVLCCVCRKTYHPAQACDHVVVSNIRAGETTPVTSNHAQVQFPEPPASIDGQFSSQEFPPSHTAYTAFSPAVQVTAIYIQCIIRLKKNYAIQGICKFLTH